MSAIGISALDQDAISNLLGSVKSRGEYDRQLRSFLDGGEPGVEVSLNEGPFKGKKPNSVKTGFESAQKREGAPENAGNVRVLVHEERVYLIRTDVQA